MSIHPIPQPVAWRDGLILSASHFKETDARTETLSHLSMMVANPWPWGFTSCSIDRTALASGQLLISCEGIFPDGSPFSRTRLAKTLARAGKDRAQFSLVRNPETGELFLDENDDAPSATALPAARLVFATGVWSGLPDWSPPVLLMDADHPMRADINRQLGALAALGAGFSATLRLPGAAERPVARVIGQVAMVLAEGVGVIEALLGAPAIPPGHLGIEALRLALGVRSAAGIFERLEDTWDPADQRGSIRRLLYAAESAASGIGLPFRASVFKPVDGTNILLVGGMPQDTLLLAIEASRPADLIAARSWFEGAALAAPDRIQEALARRVSGCTRRPIDRDARIGLSSGPLLALYSVDADVSWRGGKAQIALAAKSPPPPNTSFSILVPEGIGDANPGRSGNAPAARRRSGGHGLRRGALSGPD